MTPGARSRSTTAATSANPCGSATPTPQPATAPATTTSPRSLSTTSSSTRPGATSARVRPTHRPARSPSTSLVYPSAPTGVHMASWATAFRTGLPLLVFALLALHAGPASAADGCQEIAVTMSDGVRLDGWFIPAAAGGKAPVLWTMSPYTNTPCPGLITGMDVALRNKFTVVRLSYSGAGASAGVC